MGLLRIDRTKCKKDGICAAVCPRELIRQKGDAFPEEVPDAEQLCFECGHCVAACPTAALFNSRVTECLPFREDRRADAESVEQFLKMRRSIREFKPEPLPRDVLVHAIDTARWAPSAINIQPVRWLVVEKPERTRLLAGLMADWMRTVGAGYLQPFIDAWDEGRDLVLRNAPHVIVAHASTENIWSPVDCTIAVTYLELAAQANGLGTCWSGLLVRAAEHNPRIPEFLNLPAGHKVYGAAMIGYPRFRYHRIPVRNQAAIDWV